MSIIVLLSIIMVLSAFGMIYLYQGYDDEEDDGDDE